MNVTLAAMTLASSMVLVDQTAVPLASPAAIHDLGGGVSEGQWLMTANILPLAALMVFGGRLGDLFGLRRVFVWGAILFAVAAGIALLGALVSLVLVRRSDRLSAARVFSRRSRWI